MTAISTRILAGRIGKCTRNMNRRRACTRTRDIRLACQCSPWARRSMADFR